MSSAQAYNFSRDESSLSGINMKEVRLKENSWIAQLAAAKLRSKKVAIVVGHTIHLHNTSREEFMSQKEWLRHELRHVQQYEQYGLFGFIARYLIASVRKGYFNNPYEIEARTSERDEQIASRYRIV